MQKLLCESNNERIPPEIIKTIKLKISAQLNTVFCFKPSLKNNGAKKEKFDDIPVIFSPNISSALEIFYNEVKIEDIKSREIDAHFHFFIFPSVIDGKEYVITYAEENKYSKRKIIEVLYDNIKKKKKTEVLNNHHPIIYFLIVLLKYDESKQTKSYKLLNKYFEENNIRTSDEDNSDGEIKENKINEINEKLGNMNIDGNDNSKNKRTKTIIIDIIYSCIDEYGERLVNMARLMTIKKYFSKAVINIKIISKIFIVLNLGYLVFSDNEWYKFS
ncbi:hypothetical protein H8356DRAFT_1049161 [Neocallimastix lanati (nom. inval.)]|nr:hypothetical protein H8356DRAFT_1049161 [Neocallimastix sp. JGI-2020a]